MTELMKTADEFLNSKTYIPRWDDYIPRSTRYITKVMDEYAALKLSAERERIKNELKDKIALCQKAYDAGPHDPIRQGKLFDELTASEIQALKKGFAESMYLIDSL